MRTFRKAFVAAVLLLAGLTACSSEDGPGMELPTAVSRPPSSAAPPSDPGLDPDPNPAPVTGTPAAEQALPEPLVGVWESNEGSGTISYRFDADGRYIYVGILATQVPQGVTQITFVAEGTATTEGDTLLLRPTRSTISREDPSDPAGDYTDRPADLTPEQHAWEVTPDDLLLLTDAKGIQLTLRRQSL